MVIKLFQRFSQRRKSVSRLPKSRLRSVVKGDGDDDNDDDDEAVDDDASALELALHSTKKVPLPMPTLILDKAQRSRDDADTTALELAIHDGPEIRIPSEPRTLKKTQRPPSPLLSSGIDSGTSSLPKLSSGLSGARVVLETTHRSLSDDDDDNDEATALDLALQAEHVCNEPCILENTRRSRFPSPLSFTISNEWLSDSIQKNPSQKDEDRHDEEKMVASPINKRDHWIRSFQRDSGSSRGAITASPCQIRITPSILTGLVAVSDKKKRSESIKSNNTTKNVATCYLRLLSTTSVVNLVDGSPNVLNSVSCPIDRVGPTHRGQCVIVWVDSHPNGNGSSLIIATSVAAKEPVVTLEIGIFLDGSMIPLGTTTFQPGTIAVCGEHRQVKVKNLLKGDRGGLFRKKQQSGKNTELPYRLSRVSCLSFELNVSVCQTMPHPAVAALSNPDRSLERALTSVNADIGEINDVGQHDNNSAFCLFYSAIRYWCFGESSFGSVSPNQSEETRIDGESTCVDLVGVSASFTAEKENTHGAGASELFAADGESILSPGFFLGRIKSRLASFCCFANINHLPDKYDDAGSVGTGDHLSYSQMLLDSAHRTKTRFEIKSRERSISGLTEILSIQRWPFFYAAYCFGNHGTREIYSNFSKAGSGNPRSANGDCVSPRVKSTEEGMHCTSDIVSPTKDGVFQDPLSVCTACFGDEDVSNLRSPRQNAVHLETSSCRESSQAGSIIASCFGDADVEKLNQAKFDQKRSTLQVVKATVDQKHFKSLKSCTAKAESLKRMDALEKELTQRNGESTPAASVHNTSDSGNIARCTASIEISSMEVTSSGTIILAEEEDNDIPRTSDLEPRSRTRVETNVSKSIVEYDCCSSFDPGTRHEDKPRLDCFQLVTGLGTDDESTSSSKSSSLSGDDSLTGASDYDGEVILSPTKVEKRARTLKMAPSDLIRHIDRIDDSVVSVANH